MTAWYLKIDDAPERAVLVGDRGRVLRAADMLEDARVLNEDRGLTTAVGGWNGVQVLVSAFGMGAPIAAVVLHELAALGTTSFVRAGTMMTRGPELGAFIVADRALIHEGTSAAYGYSGPEVGLDPTMADRLTRAAQGLGDDVTTVRGTVATCDGFYTQMTDLLQDVPPALTEQWDAEHVIGLDMETSAMACAAAAIGVEFGSLCLASVDVNGPVMLEAARRHPAETQLLRASFDALTNNQDTTESERTSP